MSLTKGLGAIRESIANRGSYTPGEGIPELAIQSGEVALIHFLTDRDDIIETRFHRIPETTQNQNVITRERLCRQEVGETCSNCNHQSEDIRRRTLRWYAWVYVYGILTPNDVPNAQQIQRGARTLNLMKCDTAAILRKGEGNNKYLINQLLTNGERYGTLCDRIYEWERTGTGMKDTSYLLAPLPDLAERPKVDNLESLEEIISKEKSLAAYPSRQRAQTSASARGTPIIGDRTSQLMQLLKGSSDQPEL